MLGWLSIGAWRFPLMLATYASLQPTPSSLLGLFGRTSLNQVRKNWYTPLCHPNGTVCNSLLYDLPDKEVFKLVQHIQNSVARPITKTRNMEHITVTPILIFFYNKKTTDILNINFYSKKYIFLIGVNRQRPNKKTKKKTKYNCQPSKWKLNKN